MLKKFMTLTEIPSAILGSDLSCDVRLSGSLEGKIALIKKTTVNVNRHCMFTWWKKAKALNRALSLVWLCQRGPLTINFSLIKLITNSS